MIAIIIAIIGGKVNISLIFSLDIPTPEITKPTEFRMIIDVARKILATPNESGDNAKIIGNGKFKALENADVHNSAEDGDSWFVYFEINFGVTIPIVVTSNPATTGNSQLNPLNSIFTIAVNIRIGVKIFIVNLINLSRYTCRGDLIQINPNAIPK